MEGLNAINRHGAQEVGPLGEQTRTIEKLGVGVLRALPFGADEHTLHTITH